MMPNAALIVAQASSPASGRAPAPHPKSIIGALAADWKAYLAAFFSAASIFLMYLAESLLKSFRQPLQQSLISRPS